MDTSDYYDEVEVLWKNLLIAEINLAEKISPSLKTKLKAYIETINDVKRCFARLSGLHNRRQDLIEIHCTSGIISLNDHEQYHAVSDELLHEVKTFFSIYKTCLNSFTTFLQEAIPEANRRGLRMKSFGSLIDSLEKYPPKENVLLPLIKILSDQGRNIDKGMMAYRDKMIEHPKELSRGTLTTSEGSTKIIHGKNVELDFYPTSQEIDHTDISITSLKICFDDGSYCFYYHINPSQKIVPGKTVNLDEILGCVYDETEIHFKTHGPHTHVFTSPDFNGDVMRSLGQSNETIIQSPDPHFAWPELVIFATSTMNTLAIIVDSL